MSIPWIPTLIILYYYAINISEVYIAIAAITFTFYSMGIMMYVGEYQNFAGFNTYPKKKLKG